MKMVIFFDFNWIKLHCWLISQTWIIPPVFFPLNYLLCFSRFQYFSWRVQFPQFLTKMTEKKFLFLWLQLISATFLTGTPSLCSRFSAPVGLISPLILEMPIFPMESAVSPVSNSTRSSAPCTVCDSRGKAKVCDSTLQWKPVITQGCWPFLCNVCQKVSQNTPTPLIIDLHHVIVKSSTLRFSHKSFSVGTFLRKKMTLKC